MLRKVLLFFDPTLKDWSLAAPPLAYNLAYGAALPLGVAGAVLGLAVRPRPAGLGLLLAFAAAMTAQHVLLHTDVRYRVVIEPVLLMLAAGAVTWLGRRLPRATLAGLATAYLGLHLAIAWLYPQVFAGLKALTGLLGLG